MGFGIRTKYRRFKRWKYYIYAPQEKSGIKVKIPFLTKLKYNILGFTALQYCTYDLAHNDYRDYISTWERWQLEDVNGRFAFFLGEKVMFERTFGQVVNVPHIHCWVKCGKFINLDNNVDEVDIADELRREGSFIAKPTRSLGGGKKIHELSYDGEFRIDGKAMSEDEFVSESRKLEEYIITKKISLHEYSKKIYPHSANTIRIITAMDNKTNTTELLLAFHRFGTSKSKFVDNINSGGVFALIDNETGVMTKAKNLFNYKVDYEKHPDTGALIEGVQVPKWQELVEYLKQAHKNFPYYCFLAWDVALDESGKPYIMEINRGSDLNIQTIMPLRKSNLGRWMQKKGLLDNK